jgi:hypothetical protein
MMMRMGLFGYDDAWPHASGNASIDSTPTTIQGRAGLCVMASSSEACG